MSEVARIDLAPAVPVRPSARAWLIALLALTAAVLAAPTLGPAALSAVGTGLVATGSPPTRVDAVAVHGGGGVMGERELPALALYADWRAEWLVTMGGPTGCCDPDRTFANAAHRRLLGLGAPAESTIRIDQGISTQDELRALRRVAEQRGWRTLALSTDSWHTRRVVMEAARVFAGSGISWTVVAMDQSERLAEWWQDPALRRSVPREWLQIALIAFAS